MPSKPPIPKSRLVKLEAQSLKIHPTAQRGLLPSKLKRLMAELDLDAIGVLHAVEYEINGVRGVWIVDGQHRWRCLMDHGFGEWIVEVKIHLDAQDDARASELFLKLNDRAPVRPYDKFNNARQAGHPDAVGVAKIATEHRLKIGDTGGGDGIMRCVGALLAIYNFDGGKALSLTLDTLIGAWGRAEASLEGRIIEGLGLLYKQYNGTIDRPAMVKKLAKYPGGPSGLMGDARGLREYKHVSVGRCVAERILQAYNTGRRNGKLDPL